LCLVIYLADIMRLDLLNSHLLHTMSGSIFFNLFPHHYCTFSVQFFFLSVLPYALFLELDDWNDLMCLYQALVSLHWSLRFFSACVLYVEL
jgi:hypothetical protein